MLTKPRWILHLEGTCIFALTLFLYHAGHFRWGLFAVLFLAPDLSMLGYAINPRVGAALYNLVHTLAGPIVLLAFSVIASVPALQPYAFIWLSHLGLDRMLGFGLKYPTRFEDTHLQRV